MCEIKMKDDFVRLFAEFMLPNTIFVMLTRTHANNHTVPIHLSNQATIVGLCSWKRRWCARKMHIHTIKLLFRHINRNEREKRDEEENKIDEQRIREWVNRLCVSNLIHHLFQYNYSEAQLKRATECYVYGTEAGKRAMLRIFVFGL